MTQPETVLVSSKGRITIPARLRRYLKIKKGTRLAVVPEGNSIRLFCVPKLSKLAGVDEEMFRGTKPSEDLETMRKEWDREFERRNLWEQNPTGNESE